MPTYLAPMFSRLRTLCLGMLSLLIVSSVSGARAEDWKMYVNERFGFRLAYPPSLKPGRLTANGAGLNFTDGKFSVTAQGHFLNGRSIEDFYRDSLNALSF